MRIKLFEILNQLPFVNLFSFQFLVIMKPYLLYPIQSDKFSLSLRYLTALFVFPTMAILLIVKCKRINPINEVTQWRRNLINDGGKGARQHHTNKAVNNMSERLIGKTFLENEPRENVKNGW